MRPRGVFLCLGLFCEGGRSKYHIQMFLPHTRTHPRNRKEGFAFAFLPLPT